MIEKIEIDLMKFDNEKHNINFDRKNSSYVSSGMII